MPSPKGKAPKPTVAEPPVTPKGKAPPAKPSREDIFKKASVPEILGKPTALDWMRRLAEMLSTPLSNNDQQDLLAIGCGMSIHDREKLLSILLNNA